MFDGVIEALYKEMKLEEIDATESWRSDMEAFATRLRDVLRRHPRAVLIFATRPGPTDAYARGADNALSRLQETGDFNPRLALTMISCIRSLTVGLVTAELVQPVEPASDIDFEQIARFPALASAIAGGFDADEQFRLGLYALLEGVAAKPSAKTRNNPNETSSPQNESRSTNQPNSILQRSPTPAKS